MRDEVGEGRRGRNWRLADRRAPAFARVVKSALLVSVVGSALCTPGATAALKSTDQQIDALAGSSVVVQGEQIHSYAQATGVSPTIARGDLEVQQDATGVVEQLSAIEGGDFAGVWFDNETGQFVIPKLSSSSQLGAASVKEATDLEAGEFRLAPASFSWQELEQAQRALDRTLGSLLTANLLETSLNPETNAVTANLAGQATQSQVGVVRRALAALPVRGELQRMTTPTFQAQPASCNQTTRACDKPLRGGVYIEGTNAKVACSSAFRAIGNTTGSRYILTAGHCNKSAPEWRSPDSSNVKHVIGVSEGTFSEAGDWAKIKVDGGYWDEGSSWPSEIVSWGTNEASPISTESSSYVGESVCHSGWRTGTTCGIVSALNVTVDYLPGGKVNGLTEITGSTLCIGGGDSGGPVWTGTTAVGLISGTRSEGECGGNRVAFYAEVTKADAAMGVTVGTGLASSEYYATFQSSIATLWEKPQAWLYGLNTEDGMAANSSPSSAAYPSGGYVTAFQDWHGSLWLYSSATRASANSSLGVEAGTSPSIAMSPSGSYIVAFHAYGTGELWFYNSQTGTGWPTHSGMAAGSSPSAQWVPGLGYVIAFENQQGELMMYNVASENWVKLGLGMQPGTSPAIATAPQGGYVVAFQDWQHHLWVYSSATQVAGNTGLGMESGTSPSLAFGSDGNYLAAFHANTGEMWYYQSANSYGYSTSSGMKTGTNPSIAFVPGQGYVFAFQNQENTLWLYYRNSNSWYNTSLGMASGTSPSLTSH